MELKGRDLYRRYLRFVKTDKLMESSLKWYDNLGLFDGIRNGEYTIKIQEFALNNGLKESYVSAMVRSLVLSHVLELGDEGEVYIPGECVEDLNDIINECMIAPELEDVVDVMHACAKIGGQEGYTPEHRSLVWRAVILDEALEFVKATIEQSEGSDRRILDIGCGQGDLTIRLAEEFATKSVHGCDVSPINTQRCIDKSFDVHNTAFFTVPNIAELPPSWSTVYDVVTLFQPVPHGGTNTREVILEAARILQDDGFIIYIEPEVSINPSDKRFPESAYDLAVSYWYCLPSGLLSVPKSEYLVENTENFLSDCGLRVQSHHLLRCSIWNHAFVCIKK